MTDHGRCCYVRLGAMQAADSNGYLEWSVHVHGGVDFTMMTVG
jgi:hypothetical protein